MVGAFFIYIVKKRYICFVININQMSTINEVFKLLRERSNDNGASANISPERFNTIWPRAELKFFNNAYRVYAETQVISDSISKWMTDPIYLYPTALGRYDFFTDMNLLHVDSMNGYLTTTPTGSIGGITLTTGGTGYTNGVHDSVVITGGSGSGALANITVAGGIVTKINYFNDFGLGYTVANTLTASGLGGSGFVLTITSLVEAIPYDITRSEKNRIAAHLSSTYDAPDREFSIYTQYKTWFQFYPKNIVAQLVYLKNPTPSFWGYKLQGSINTLTGLVGGSSYTNGVYTNVPLTSGFGNSALATITVAGGAVTTVTLTNNGKVYHTGDMLSALSANIGGTGTGFTITISSISNPRAVYDPTTSIQPLWNDNDISLIVDYALQDAAVNSRDMELQNFAQTQSQSKLLQ